jgi:hypothetical protein
MNKTEKYRLKMQVMTLRHLGARDWQRYTPKEEALILDTDVSLYNIALDLGRSYRAVQEKRKKLRREARRN